MHITLNGDAREFPLDTTVNELLETLGYAGKRVAVERNGEIVPKSQHAQTALSDGDQIESGSPALPSRYRCCSALQGRCAPRGARP